MLQIIGERGKSIIVDAIQQYNNARVYIYDEEIIQQLDCYFMSSKEFSVEEFCESVYKDMVSLENDFPVKMVVLYTNSQNINIISEIWECANKLEEENLAAITVVASR